MIGTRAYAASGKLDNEFPSMNNPVPIEMNNLDELIGIEIRANRCRCLYPESNSLHAKLLSQVKAPPDDWVSQ
jgi:hypothetical protein